MKGIIYKWTCNVNGKSYVGQTTNERKRENDFLNESKSYAGAKIDNARKKYGLSEGTWTKTVLKRLWCKDGKEDELRERLNYWERYYITLFNTIKDGYNMTDGGDSDFSIDVIEEMRKKSKERWDKLTEEEKENHKEKSTTYWNSLTNEKRIAIINKSRKKYKEWRVSISDEEFKKRVIDCHRGHSILRNINSSKLNKGRKRSEESKEKIRKINRENAVITFSKMVEKYPKDKSTLLETFNTIEDACKSVGVSSKHFSEQIKKNNGLYKGHYWIIKEKKRDNKYPSGCLWDKRLQRWRSRIGDYHLGCFKNMDAASEIYQIAKKKKEEGTFDEWYKNIFEHKIKIYEKYGEKMRNLQ